MGVTDEEGKTTRSSDIPKQPFYVVYELDGRTSHPEVISPS
jgi:hypothetical protein